MTYSSAQGVMNNQPTAVPQVSIQTHIENMASRVAQLRDEASKYADMLYGPIPREVSDVAKPPPSVEGALDYLDRIIDGMANEIQRLGRRL